MDYYNNETILEQAGEIEALRQQLAAAKETDLLLRNLLCVIHRDGGHHITAHGLDQSVQDAMEVFYNLRDLPEQLAAALAACEAKDKVLESVDDFSATGWLHADAVSALAIKPDASALKAHNEALIERCAEVCEELKMWPTEKVVADDCAVAIRELKGTL